MKFLKRIMIALFCVMLPFTAFACEQEPQSSSSGTFDSSDPSSESSSSADSSSSSSSSESSSSSSVEEQGGIDLGTLTVSADNIPLKLQYDEPAPFINECSEEASMMAGQDIGWQNWSMPIGNGYIGANVFGRTETERVQITEKTLSNPWQYVLNQNGSTSYPQIGGLNNFSETYIDFGHVLSGVTNYNRYLDLRKAISGVSYTYKGVNYSREYFTSYPDKALVIRLNAQGGDLSFTLRPTIPFKQSYMKYPGDGFSKTGSVVSSVEGGVGCIELSGTLGYYGVDFVGYYRVYTNGGSVVADTVNNTYTDKNGTVVTDKDGVIRVSGASSAYIVATFGTDYELCSENFEGGQYGRNKQTAKTTLDDARAKVGRYLRSITTALSIRDYEEGYEYLKSKHLGDYGKLFGRVDLNLNCNSLDFALTTDKLLEKYNSGSHSSYLETLLFQYGRYLIIASSREGALPANLQGAWNCYNTPAWSSGYWSNINIQMNYWHAFSTNLAETFIPYVDYNSAYMKVAEQYANDTISKHNPDVYGEDGGNGWAMSVAGNPFFFNADRSSGNLGLLTQVFYDYYQFTKDEEVLETVYEVLANAARFITKCVKEYDGKYLVEYCDSPEMYVNGVWYYTTGTAYAQTMAYLNNYQALECAKALGIDLEDNGILSLDDYSILKTIMNQLDKYDPIHVGLSGQIKEFREEDYYGSLGNPNHRHISQLVGLFPGNLINSSTEAWLDAALVSLYGRNNGLMDWPNGNTSNNEASIVAWAWAHKQALYARAGEGDLAQQMLAGNLRNSTLENLLMVCGKIFQIEASSGTTAALAEMLLQSDEQYIEILPALPNNWSKGSYTGLVARGNFEVSVDWENSVASRINILSKSGGSLSVKYPSVTGVKVYNSAGEEIKYSVTGKNVITFNTEVGETYYFDGLKRVERPEKPTEFTFERVNFNQFDLSWNAVDGAVKYNVYIAIENDASYTFVGSSTKPEYLLTIAKEHANLRKTFVVTAENASGVESKRALCYSNPILTDLEVYSATWEIVEGEIKVEVSANESAGKINLYERALGESEFTLISQEKGTLITANYNPNSQYAVSILSKYDNSESELIVLTEGNCGNNILIGKQFVSAKESALNYSALTDGKPFNDEAGTFIASGEISAIVDFEGVYSLSNVKIFVSGGIEYAGDYLKLERLYEGEWIVLAEFSTNSQIEEYFVAQNECVMLEFDDEKANKLRISAKGSNIALNEVTAFGALLDEKVELINLFSGKQFIPTSETAGNIYSATYGYQTLTDGVIYEEFNGRYSSKQNGGKIEAIIDLQGARLVSTLKVYLYKDGISKFGSGFEVQAYFDGEWSVLVNCATTSEIEKYLVKNEGGVGNWLIFNLGDAYASKVKIVIPGQTSSGWTTLYEIECYGTASTVVESMPEPDPDPNPQLIANVFSGKQFVPTEAANAEILIASWFKGGGYETLTDGNKVEEQVGRFSTKMNDTTAFMDATLDFGEQEYELCELKFYLYDTKDSITLDAKKTSVGKDILIQIYYNGEWKEVVNCVNSTELLTHLVINEGLNNDYLLFDLQGVKAQKIRFFISGSAHANGITFQEIECNGKLVK